MYKLLRQGFQDYPTTLGPNGEVILNLARQELERIDMIPQKVNVLIMDHNYIRRLENLINLHDLQQVQAITSHQKLIQFSIQSNPCTTLPPEEYEPLILAYLPRLQILNGVIIQPETRAQAQQLQAKQASSKGFNNDSPVSQISNRPYRRGNTASDESITPPLQKTATELPADLLAAWKAISSHQRPSTDISEVSIQSTTHLISDSRSDTDNPMTPTTRTPRLVSSANSVPTTAMAHAYTPLPPLSEPINHDPCDPATRNVTPVIAMPKTPEFNEVPVIAFRSILGVKPDLEQLTTPAILSQASPPISIQRVDSPVDPEVHGGGGNPCASSMLVSESVYWPVTSSVMQPQRAVSPTKCYGSGVNKTTPQNPMHTSSSCGYGIPSLRSSDGSANGQWIAGSRGDLDPNRLRSDEMTTPSQLPMGQSSIDLRDTLQSSFSMLPVNQYRLECIFSRFTNLTEERAYMSYIPSLLKSTTLGSPHHFSTGQSMQNSPQTLTPRICGSQYPHNPPTAPHFDSVYLLQDEEDTAERDEVRFCPQFQPVRSAMTPYAAVMSSPPIAPTRERPLSHDCPPFTHPVIPDPVDVNQLMQRSSLHNRDGMMTHTASPNFIDLGSKGAEKTEKTRRSLDFWSHPAATRVPERPLEAMQFANSPRTMRTANSYEAQLPRQSFEMPSAPVYPLPPTSLHSDHPLERGGGGEYVDQSTADSTTCPPSCSSQARVLQDHIVLLQTQLQAQYKAALAEARLRQMHSSAIEFLLNEVQSLKAWKEQCIRTTSVRHFSQAAELQRDCRSGEEGEGRHRIPSNGDTWLHQSILSDTAIDKEARGQSMKVASQACSNSNSDFSRHMQSEVIKVYASDEEREVELGIDVRPFGSTRSSTSLDDLNQTIRARPTIDVLSNPLVAPMEEEIGEKNVSNSAVGTGGLATPGAISPSEEREDLELVRQSAMLAMRLQASCSTTDDDEGEYLEDATPIDGDGRSYSAMTTNLTTCVTAESAALSGRHPSSGYEDVASDQSRTESSASSSVEPDSLVADWTEKSSIVTAAQS